MQCESWWNLAKQFASRSPPLHLLSSSVQRSLMKALVLGGFAHMDTDTKQQYWAEVTVLIRSPKSCSPVDNLIPPLILEAFVLIG